MAKYINKDALIAEIERRIEEYKSMKIDSSYYDGMVASLEFLRDEFLDSLEVKEVDLKKESLTWEDMLIIHRCIKDAMNYHLSASQTIEGQQKVYEDVLKRFKAYDTVANK